MNRYPQAAACLELMDQEGMLDNIRRHSIMVARVTLTLLDHLTPPPGADPPDAGLCLAGALLHDIAKTPCLGERCDHARMGAEICRDRGWEEVAMIVEEHVILRRSDPSHWERGVFRPAEMVYYADKRVRHEEVVDLETRLDYILESYGRGDPLRHRLIRENFQRCVELEGRLFARMDIRNSELEAVLVEEERITGRQP